MSNAINKSAVFALFNEVENQSASWSCKLFDLGVFSREEARPLCIEWAEGKYDVKAKDGQRGKGFDVSTTKGNAAHQAVKRVLSTCFPSEGKEASEKQVKFDAAKVAKQLKSKYSKAQLAKLIAELS
jgi:hypothetical protein